MVWRLWCGNEELWAGPGGEPAWLCREVEDEVLGEAVREVQLLDRADAARWVRRWAHSPE